MTHFAKCQKDLNVSKAQQTWGLGFVVLLGKQLWIEAKTQEEVERPERHCVFFAHFSLFTFHWICLFTSFHSDHFLMRSLFRSFSLSPVLISVGNIVCASHKTNCEVVNYMVIEYRCRLLEDEKKMRTNPQNEINENARKPKLKSQYVSRQNYLKIKLKSWVQRPKEDPVSITITDTSLQEPEVRKPKYKARKTYFLKLGQGPEYSYPNLWMYLFL